METRRRGQAPLSNPGPLAPGSGSVFWPDHPPPAPNFLICAPFHLLFRTVKKSPQPPTPTPAPGRGAAIPDHPQKKPAPWAVPTQEPRLGWDKLRAPGGPAGARLPGSRSAARLQVGTQAEPGPYRVPWALLGRPPHPREQRRRPSAGLLTEACARWTHGGGASRQPLRRELPAPPGSILPLSQEWPGRHRA